MYIIVPFSKGQHFPMKQIKFDLYNIASFSNTYTVYIVLEPKNYSKIWKLYALLHESSEGSYLTWPCRQMEQIWFIKIWIISDLSYCLYESFGYYSIMRSQLSCWTPHSSGHDCICTGHYLRSVSDIYYATLLHILP